MTPRLWLFFGLTVFIWGSSWYATKLQLGVVEPMVSVAWRFLAAGAIMAGICVLAQQSLRLTARQHAWVAAQGLGLFCLNYLFFYTATAYLTSGLVAVIASTMVFWNALLAHRFLGARLDLKVVIGGMVGVLGLILIFFPEIFNLNYGAAEVGAMLAAGFATLCASAGSIVSARNQKAGINLWANTAWGMGYGGGILLVYAVLTGRPLAFEMSLSYVLSFGFLVIFGSVVAFCAYLYVLGKVGPARAAFVMLLFPAVALGISTAFEGFVWNVEAILGFALVLYGNRIALKNTTG